MSLTSTPEMDQFVMRVNRALRGEPRPDGKALWYLRRELENARRREEAGWRSRAKKPQPVAVAEAPVPGAPK